MSDYEEIEAIVMRYQQGEQDAAKELLTRFGWHDSPAAPELFIGKYYRLLRYGVIDFSDKDTRQFVKCFSRDRQLSAALTPFYQYKQTKKAARKIVQRLNDHLAYLDEQELENWLVELFLEKALRYRKVKEKVNFCGYLYGTFRFDVSDRIKKEMKDALASFSIEADEDFPDWRNEIDIADIGKDDLYFEKEVREFGLNWALGQTASFPFSTLSVFERSLILLTDVQNLSLTETGERMGYHRDTIWRKRKKIKDKLLSATLEE